MAAIKSKNTRTEHMLRKALRARGLTGYRCHHRKLPGKPDVAFTRWRIAIFIDGAFWHGHPDHFTFGKLGAYWDDKIHRTQKRDLEQEVALTVLGYRVTRFWDFEVKEDAERCAQLIEEMIASERRVKGRPPSRAGGR